ncbi:MAG: nitroreductase [Bacteroidia bacterium]|nr:MAG: nitroreductase [Bacteroidia bacterium]
MLKAGQLAPSASNAQPWHFVVVDEQPLLGKIHEAYKRDWFQKVPAVIVAYGNHSVSWKRSYDKKDHCDIDVAIAVDHMMLRAESLGVGTCWICHFDPQFLKEILPIQESWEPISILALGYTDSEKQPLKKRKELKDIIGYNEW